MHQQDKAILRGLVAVAWADGRFASEEREMLDMLLAAFDATNAETEEIRQYATKERTLEDIPINDLSPDDRRTLLNHAVVLTFIDGEQHEKEKELVHKLAGRLGIDGDEANRVIAAAEGRAKRLLELLK